MPVQEQTPYIKYVANGVTQTFSTEFDCESKDQLVVMLNGEEPVFTSWSYADKQVTFLIAPVADTVVELKRQSKLKRLTDYQSFNHTLNYKALNSDLDRIWYVLQEQRYKVGQYDFDYNFVLTQVRPITTGGTGADNSAGARNNLDVYSKGQVDALVATGGQGNIVLIGGGGTGADNAEEARANLDVYSQAEVDFKIDEATPNATETIAGKAKIATTAIAQAGVNDTDMMTPKKVKDQVSMGGRVHARVYVSTISAVSTILGSKNILSVVRDSVGVHKITTITAMDDLNFTIIGTASLQAVQGASQGYVLTEKLNASNQPIRTINSFEVLTFYASTADAPRWGVIVVC